MAATASEPVTEEFERFETREMRVLKALAAAYHDAEEFGERNKCLRQYDRIAFGRWREGLRPHGLRRTSS